MTSLTSPNRLPKSRWIGLVLLGVLWLLFSLWQWFEHHHQCQLIRSALSSQAEALSNAVNSSIQSHRWFGPFVQQQLPSTLEVLARADNVIAIAVVVDDDSDHAYTVGDPTAAECSLPDGEFIRGEMLQFVSSLEMPGNPPAMKGRGMSANDLAPSVGLKSIIVLDRSGTIAQMRREAMNRLLIFALGTLLLLAIGAGWHFTVRLAQAEGTARLLTAETRHLRELGQAAAGLAHETRNPLGLIRGWTQRLVDSGLPNDDQQEQAEAVLEECDRVTARINQFLAFARQAELNVEPMELVRLVDELETLLRSDLDERKLSLNKTSLDQPPLILADRNQLRQVLFNLLQNAIAFAPERSTIAMLIKRGPTGTYRLEIADQGPGVPEEIAGSLFDPYVTRRPGGTGLGLSIVRRIAVAHDWDVGYQPGPQGGSVFWIEGIRAA